MVIEPLSSIEDALPFLVECGLPVSDITLLAPPSFFGIRLGGTLVGVVGLETYPPFGLLRSLAVAPTFRSSGIGHKLVAFVESQAAARDINELFLLTTTAENFFLELGYSSASRVSAPPVIQGTSQFSGLCPSSSAFLCKHVGAAC
ncbi:MAG TPA: arsenic resistance N-acetyltransferase ArsN2 [Rhodocyclaceae bacterium]|nr:arsenic resistance N-acetyltransferase ArsN2 [Rhodocyclaceae bacterium]